MAVSAITTEVQVANLALARLGQAQTATSLESPTTTDETLCALHFPQTRKALLRAYLFNFAKEYAQLEVDDAETPAFGFSLAYSLPTDFIRLLAIGDVTINADLDHQFFDLTDQHIYTDEVSDTDDSDDSLLNVYYVKDVSTVARWDALFLQLMRLQLAKDMAYAFTLKPSLVAQIDAELADVKIQAMAAAGQEKRPRRIQRSRIIAARRPGGGRDLSRYSI